jgi:hypothetical protein
LGRIIDFICFLYYDNDSETNPVAKDVHGIGCAKTARGKQKIACFGQISGDSG